MVEQQQRTGPEEAREAREARRRRAGIAALLGGLVATLAFFAFCPGLPHVIDWGAILTAVAAGLLARWACRSRMAGSAGGRRGGG
ncbi:hypothetical protein [Streptomyces sp. NPDC006193]|uniref:hypothetical protein n=1 Tax=Streptomyces sp. NPDC006193 TaxID=3155717 RepID=UPI0033B8D8C6